jgi:hypothetical protein
MPERAISGAEPPSTPSASVVPRASCHRRASIWTQWLIAAAGVVLLPVFGFIAYRFPHRLVALSPQQGDSACAGDGQVRAFLSSGSHETRRWSKPDSNFRSPWRLGRSAPRKSRGNSSAVRVGTARDTVSLQPGSEASKPMPGPSGGATRPSGPHDLFLERPRIQHLGRAERRSRLQRDASARLA